MVNTPTTELTTAATDALLGAVCLAMVPPLVGLLTSDPWKASLWITVFVLTAAASLLGTVVHGVALRQEVRDALWQPLYLVLGIVVALFVVGAVRDWLGEAVARRLLLPAMVAGVIFWVCSRALGGSFTVFVVYQGVAMGASLLIYAALAHSHSSPGAATIAAAIALNLVAAAIQASSLQVTVIWPFDHNGLFHLVQIGSAVLLQHGVRTGLLASASPAPPG